ncbi:MAG: RNA polymerase sigma factor [Actinomycetota bacterium]
MDAQSEGIAELYREQGPRMWRALLGFTGDPELASDALAEAFARALRDGDRIRDVSAWTWRVAFRVASADLRLRSSAPAPAAPVAYEMPEPVPELMGALRSLSPNQRLAVVLHDYADRPTGEVAEVLGCSRATVHVHLSQGRRRLRALLEDTDE